MNNSHVSVTLKKIFFTYKQGKKQNKILLPAHSVTISVAHVSLGSSGLDASCVEHDHVRLTKGFGGDIIMNLRDHVRCGRNVAR